MDLLDYLKENYQLDIKNKEFYLSAFTHSSYLNECKEDIEDYERIEFLGDAVVEIWVSKKLFLLRPKLSEGAMTTLRAQLVCENTLSTIMRTTKLQNFIRLGVGEEKSNARDRDSLLCDVFEAFIGAVYLDNGYQKASEILDNLIDVKETSSSIDFVDYKSRLQEIAQADNRKVLKYSILKETGPSNNPTFTVGVYLDEVLLGTGVEHSKKKAEQIAAKEALGKLAK